MNLRWNLLVLALLIVVCAGCRDTLNVGTPTTLGRITIDNVDLSADNWNAGETATLAVSWYGVNPYHLEIYLGTSASQPAVDISDLTDNFYQCGFTLEEGTSFNYSIKVTSGEGVEAYHTGTYGPVGPPLNSAPEIVSAVYDEPSRVLTVTVTDAEGDDVEVAVTPVAGLTVDQDTRTVTGGNGVAEFLWYADDTFLGGSGTTTVTVSSEDSVPAQDVTRDIEITVAPMEIILDEGVLAMIPLETSTTVGETVTVIVATGPFPAEAPFAFMNGVAVTVTDGGEYVSGTFNVGTVGGDVKDTDGIWARLDPAPAAYFIPEEFMMAPADVSADSSLDFMGFNITPVNGGETTEGGILFNFGMVFDAAGTYELGYLDFQDVKRTYYSGLDAAEHYWPEPDGGNIFSATITVNE